MDYLTIPLRRRQALRAKDPTNFAKYPQAVGGIWTREGSGSSFVCGPSKDLAWMETPSIRFVSNAQSILPRLRHTGWYVDNQGGETTVGVVYRLTHGRFVAGCSDPWNSDKAGRGPFLMDAQVFDSPEEAARRADRLAELYAEQLREEDSRFQAEQAREEAKAELAQLREEARELVAGIRDSRLAPSVCERLRRDFKALRRDMSKLWRAIEA